MRTLISTQRLLMLLGVFLIAMLGTATGWADGGGGGPSAGPGGSCRVQIGSHLVNFTAYQPQLAGNTPYCKEIPELGNVAVVFDYEDKALRNLTVEFEVIKEGGAAVLQEPPGVHPTGTFTRTINFTEAGDYIARVIVHEDGKKHEAEVPFGVAEDHGISMSNALIIAVILMTVGYFLYQSNMAFQDAVKRIWAKLG